MIELYVDGASARNIGKSGIGIFIKGEGHSIQLSEPIEASDNHSAEFQALLRGVQEVAKLTNGMVSARSDSQVVVNAIEKEFIKNVAYSGFLQSILEITSTFEYFFIKWIPDEQNRTADSLARQAIQQQR